MFADNTTAPDASITAGWIDQLRQSQSDDGGFGAAPGQPSNSESTALTLIALRAHPQHASNADRARDWLVRRQRADGSWALIDGADDGSWVTPWAMLALQSEGDVKPEVLQRGADWLAHREGRRLGFVARMLFRWLPAEERTSLDPELVGWPWHAGSFSWVEPTSVALLALKRMRNNLADHYPKDRVEQGERMLYDRQCENGGWNYGNRAVLGEELLPYPDVTAIALLALQDQPPQQTAKSRKSLEEMLAGEEASGLALALGCLCASVYGNDPTTLRQRLLARYRRTGFLGELRTLAFASLAFNGAEGFRLS
jgi:hypothetical protein